MVSNIFFSVFFWYEFIMFLEKLSIFTKKKNHILESYALVERNIDCPLGVNFVMLTENYVSKKKTLI